MNYSNPCSSITPTPPITYFWCWFASSDGRDESNPESKNKDTEPWNLAYRRRPTTHWCRVWIICPSTVFFCKEKTKKQNKTKHNTSVGYTRCPSSVRSRCKNIIRFIYRKTQQFYWTQPVEPSPIKSVWTFHFPWQLLLPFRKAPRPSRVPGCSGHPRPDGAPLCSDTGVGWGGEVFAGAAGGQGDLGQAIRFCLQKPSNMDGNGDFIIFYVICR